MSPYLLKSAMKLSKAEKILLAEQLWDSVADDQDAPPLTSDQKTEIDRRLARIKRTGSRGSTCTRVKRRIKNRA